MLLRRRHSGRRGGVALAIGAGLGGGAWVTGNGLGATVDGAELVLEQADNTAINPKVASIVDCMTRGRFFDSRRLDLFNLHILLALDLNRALKRHLTGPALVRIGMQRSERQFSCAGNFSILRCHRPRLRARP